MLVFKNTCKCFQNLCLKHNCIHICSIRTQPTNTNHIVCLGFTHSNMKQFLSLFKFKWLKPLNTQHPTFCAQDKSPNPNSNPNAPNSTICQKHCHNLYLKSYPKQFNEQLEVCTLAFPQTNQFCSSPPHHSKNHIGHLCRTFNSMTLN